MFEQSCKEVALDQATPPSSLNLPPELLSRIFEYYIQSCRSVWDQGPPNEQRPPYCIPVIGPYTWIRVTHVCRYWRDVALADALLWSHIVLIRSLDCIQAMLARSQQAPLIVQSYTSSCQGEYAAPLGTLRLALTQLHRIRTIELYIKWWVFEAIATALEKPAPLLESFKLSTPSGLNDVAFVPPVLWSSYNTVAPSLKNITLISYGFPWRNPIPFRSLKNLRIERGTTHCPSVEDVLRALHFMPDLVSLRLLNIFNSSARELKYPPALPNIVSLNALKDLGLFGDCLSYGALLDNLHLPSMTTLVLALPPDHHTDHVTFILRAVYAKFPSNSSNRPKTNTVYDPPSIAFDLDRIFPSHYVVLPFHK